MGVEPVWACVIVRNDNTAAVTLEVTAVVLRNDNAVPADEQRQTLRPRVFLRPDERLRDSLGTARSFAPGEELRMVVLPRRSDERRARVRYHVHYWHEITLRVGVADVTVTSDVGEFRYPRGAIRR